MASKERIWKSLWKDTGHPSTCVADLSYNPDTMDLTIEFQKRGTYLYREVPPDVWLDFTSSGSQGTFFNSSIRNRYSYERIA